MKIKLYVSLASNALDVPLEDVAKINIYKLKKRYPNGFEVEKSINKEEQYETIDENKLINYKACKFKMITEIIFDKLKNIIYIKFNNINPIYNGLNNIIIPIKPTYNLKKLFENNNKESILFESEIVDRKLILIKEINDNAISNM